MDIFQGVLLHWSWVLSIIVTLSQGYHAKSTSGLILFLSVNINLVTWSLIDKGLWPISCPLSHPKVPSQLREAMCLNFFLPVVSETKPLSCVRYKMTSPQIPLPSCSSLGIHPLQMWNYIHQSPAMAFFASLLWIKMRHGNIYLVLFCLFQSSVHSMNRKV